MKKAFRVIIAVMFFFFLCWTPYNILLIIDTLSSGGETCAVRSALEKARIITSTIGYLHCCLNPILYGFGDSKFRRQVGNLVKCFGCGCKCMRRTASVIWYESAEEEESV